MTLREAIQYYIAWRQAHGVKYKSGAAVLNLFLKGIDGEIGCDGVTEAQLLAFLAGKGPLTRHCQNKYCVLAGFCRFAISRGHAHHTPLPGNEPKPPARRRPYIYSHDELRRLFDTIEVNRRGAVNLDADTFRTLLLLLYGAGLRVGEARRFILADVDLSSVVLTIRDTKFFKSRLVPVGPRLAAVLKEYASLRADRPLPQGGDSFFLVNRNGTPLAHSTLWDAFARLCRAAEIGSANGVCRPPCLHAFRHSFAVHTLTAWYRQGADVQRLLPVLSTYLGHSDLEGTKVYLSMTPELLQQASLRFARYADGGRDA
ncbi:MAG: tyrosine-type recombinase/integrase [Stellaceae bacterium]